MKKHFDFVFNGNITLLLLNKKDMSVSGQQVDFPPGHCTVRELSKEISQNAVRQ
jgi:hypothetical protein